MKYNDYYDHRFRRDVDKALKSIERILHVDRKPQLAEDVEHSYENKYEMADLLTNTTIIALMNALERLGLKADVLKALDRTRTTTMRFQAKDSIEFLSDKIVELPSTTSFETKEVTKASGSIFPTSEKSTIRKVVKKVKEFHWRATVSWEIVLYTGSDASANRVVLQSRQSSIMIVTQSKAAPMPQQTTHEPVEVSLNWLMRMVDTDQMAAQFKIDREDKDTRTPYRNKQTADALEWFSEISEWCSQFYSHFEHHVESIVDKHNPAKQEAPRHGRRLKSIEVGSMFCPTQPLMEEQNHGADGATAMDTGMDTDTAAADDDDDDVENLAMISLKPASPATTATAEGSAPSKPSPLMSTADINRLLNEQIKSIEESTASLLEAFPARQLDRLVSASEATIVMLCKHVGVIRQQYACSMAYIEEMLKTQLVSAIGKTVGPHDLDQFMRYHNAKFLKPAPQPFCHAIRRPDHHPDGLLSIEGPDADGKMEPIETLCRSVEAVRPLEIPLNAATTLELGGSMSLHGWVQHRFGDSSKNFELTARARQFSAFILIIGNMAGPSRLNPKDAIIIQNKDEVLIPLLLEEMPTAKEFKDAIKSLSPEQQRFAKAFRSMQLESSVFGVCIVQIKPQLETLLGLPSDALTKEIQLTQDLMRLFIEYQVPSDLLSFDGSAGASLAAKVENVKVHVKAVLDVIEGEKTKQLEEQTKRAKMALEQQREEAPMLFGAGAPPPPGEAYMGGGGGRGGRGGRVLAAAPVAYSMAAPPKGMKKKSRARTAKNASFQASAMPELQMAAMNVAMEGKVVASDGMDLAESLDWDSADISPPEPAGGDASTNDGHQPAGDQLSGKDDWQSTSQLDFTAIPKLLDASMEKHDPDNALRSTTIKTSSSWTHKRQINLLSKPEANAMSSDEVKSEKSKAFELLDALSRSGSLGIEHSDLHVIVCVTHCFENDVMGTVIQDNVNPIEKMERSTLLIGSAIHGVPARDLISKKADLPRLQSSFPLLMLAGGVTEK